MDEHEINQDWWSVTSSEKSINGKFENLNINSSFDSSKESQDKIERGNPSLKKSLPQCNGTKKIVRQKKSITSPFVLPFLEDEFNLDLSKSSGYNSSISPSKDNSAYNYIHGTHQCLNISPSVLQNNIRCDKTSLDVANKCHQFTNRVVKKFIKDRIWKKKGSNNGSERYIFDFGDTNLIKSCRIGQVSVVERAILELQNNNQLDLIDHRNFANETALLIATYQMNEVLINLLLKYDAKPTLPLAMQNNVLHFAAAMHNDIERRTLKYLINGIKQYQPEHLFAAITNKNIYNFSVFEILQSYKEPVAGSCFMDNCLQKHINKIQYLIKTLHIA